MSASTARARPRQPRSKFRWRLRHNIGVLLSHQISFDEPQHSALADSFRHKKALDDAGALY